MIVLHIFFLETSLNPRKSDMFSLSFLRTAFPFSKQSGQNKPTLSYLLKRLQINHGFLVKCSQVYFHKSIHILARDKCKTNKKC